MRILKIAAAAAAVTAFAFGPALAATHHGRVHGSRPAVGTTDRGTGVGGYEDKGPTSSDPESTSPENS